jgi:hypothetical protein
MDSPGRVVQTDKRKLLEVEGVCYQIDSSSASIVHILHENFRISEEVADESRSWRVTSLEAQPLPRSVAYVAIPRSIEVIQIPAFAGCHWLRAIDFAPDAMLCEVSGFQGCGITCITIPSHGEIVTETAFADCLALEIVRFTRDSNPIGRDDNRSLGFSRLSISAAHEVYSAKRASYN